MPGCFHRTDCTNRSDRTRPSGYPRPRSGRSARPSRAPIARHHLDERVLALLSNLDAAGLEVIKTENLYTFDGEAGFSKGQGK